MNVCEFAAMFWLLFFFGTVELIRRQKIDERYAILWLLLSLFMLAFSGFPGLLNSLSRLVHVDDAPPLLFLIAMVFTLIFIMHITIVISRLHRRLTRLTQELALMKAELELAGKPDEKKARRPS